MSKEDLIQKWSPWIGGFIILFLLLIYTFLGPLEQTAFTGEINIAERSAKVHVESDNDKIVYSVIFGFFGSLIIMMLIWGAVKVYEIRHK